MLQGAEAKAGGPPSPPPGRDIVAEARAAAAAGDEEEGMEGAAAKAAARAASLGVAAASTGYSSLGGVDEHVGPACSCLTCVAICLVQMRHLPATWSCNIHAVACMVMPGACLLPALSWVLLIVACILISCYCHHLPAYMPCLCCHLHKQAQFILLLPARSTMTMPGSCKH